MSSFSDRFGLKPVREAMQIDSMDQPLRIGLWNVLNVYCWEKIQWSRSTMISGRYLSSDENSGLFRLCRGLWASHFGKPLDEMENEWDDVFPVIRELFFRQDWNQVYDFVEFVHDNFLNVEFQKVFSAECNKVLEKEMSGYRFVEGSLARITSEQEIEEIENALKTEHDGASIHIRRSLELLSDRESPDYRNSIKESISGVESLVKSVLSEENGTLGQLLNRLEDEVSIHGALKSAFSNLYGYTSDEGGIRHALMDRDTCGFQDAKFMLVVCSAFINYVVVSLDSTK